MHLREGVYYLSYSHGGWRDASYSVHYATGSSAVGPWTYRGPILESDQRNKGPGHHSFVHDQRSGRDLIFYHRWEDQTGTGPFRGSRVLAVDTVEYDSEGLIRPIRMGRPADGRTAAGAILSPR